MTIPVETPAVGPFLGLLISIGAAAFFAVCAVVCAVAAIRYSPTPDPDRKAEDAPLE